MEFVEKSVCDLVQANPNWDKKAVSIDFNPAVVDPEDLETPFRHDCATNAALEQIDETTKKKLELLK